ncbi:hypothetical protein QQ008_28460 [Fulvivirgaceae bacterium BMA10]|uniref:Uncharacterized protein n=1 Tax=Splendidivirga corallicola TaxID=3051826 RepID=A0ABT8KX21_9BACT|nr:hypothetical protein [Fulvivirgaceae bacterium BMA10]
MGKWKYFNWTVVVVIWFFMFGTFIKRYEAPTNVYIYAITGWFLMVLLGFYIFGYKLKKTSSKQQLNKSNLKKNNSNQASNRPKVSFQNPLDKQ